MAEASDATGPDHVIVWLDKNMGQPPANRDCKTELATSANPDNLPSRESFSDIDILIQRINLNGNDQQQYELINNVLHMFTNEEDCIKFIHQSREANKKVFLITSGEMGASIVPKIYQQLSGSIYIFCAQRLIHDEWAAPYSTGVEIYDDEKGVFAKVLLDIGIYYYMRTEEETLSNANAIEYLTWAQRLVIRASELNPRIDRNGYLTPIDEKLVSLGASGLNNDTTGEMETRR
jgi:hypothetical protein